MISEKELKEIRELLKSSENPLFFYDDDPDGLCSFILLRKYIGRGRGVVIKSSPILTTDYLRKVEEYTPDRIFVLDKPILSKEFVERANTSIVWIDHHEPIKVENVRYYNPRLKNPKDNRSTSYWCYKVTKSDIWVAVCGVVGDWQIPEFIEEFKKRYPGLVGSEKDPGEILYNTELGKLIRILSFILKNRTSEINKCAKMLCSINNPFEILNKETPKGKYIYKSFEIVEKKYKKLLNAAIRVASKENFVVFTYPSSRHSFTGDLANELIYRFPEKFILVAREKGDEMKMSMRCMKIEILDVLKKALAGVDGYGGGHEHACGANVKKSDFDKFIKNLKSEYEKVLRNR